MGWSRTSSTAPRRTAADLREVLDRVSSGEARLTSDEALALFQGADLFDLGEAADRVRARIHPNRVVSYIVDRNVNYTNVCDAYCLFCAFYRPPGDEEGYVLSRDEIHAKIRETIEAGGVQVLMQGGLHPDLPFSYYEDLVRDIKANFPIHLHAFSPPEVLKMCEVSGLGLREVLERLRAAGLDTIPGGGAEILTDRVRKRASRLKCSAADWLSVMREAHKVGMRTSATMMFGLGDEFGDRVEHLEKLRQLQDETGGFQAFIVWTFQPMHTRYPLPSPGGIDYLRTLAISRLYLDNVRNLQASWLTQGHKIGQMALRFGANDFGSTLMEENVVRAAGVTRRTTEDELRRLASELGFTPRRRDCYYQYLE
ncbi:MAG: dehypoxanthine futalosine cyclase [Planctomycetes bacterium]|nr:dehypoxanthine futalosine cyclase [Planctomycetota bacterium]